MTAGRDLMLCFCMLLPSETVYWSTEHKHPVDHVAKINKFKMLQKGGRVAKHFHHLLRVIQKSEFSRSTPHLFGPDLGSSKRNAGLSGKKKRRQHFI